VVRHLRQRTEAVPGRLSPLSRKSTARGVRFFRSSAADLLPCAGSDGTRMTPRRGNAS
jgi:hypothetical protein